MIFTSYDNSHKKEKMKNLLSLLLLITFQLTFSQKNNYVDNYEISQDFGKIIQDLSNDYIYLKDKKTDFSCVKEKYAEIVSKVKTNQEKILFFEYLLNEFYDSNLQLNAKTKSSFRLHSPLHIVLKEDKFYVQNIWFSQIKDFGKNIIGAEVLNFNSKEFNKVIDDFPVQCVNKKIPEVREWIANKIISGRLNESRVLTLKLVDDRKISLNVDNIKIREERKLLSVLKKDDFTVIKINNSLNHANFIRYFDNQLNANINAKGLILDLRNTTDGKNSYVANAILSRFIDSEVPFKKNVTKDKFGNNPAIIKSRLEFVNPRGIQFKQPVIVLVGKWTGSVGQDVAIGLDGINRGKILGTKMMKLAGETKDYLFTKDKYGYRISTDKVYTANGIIRENFIPKYHILQQSTLKDDVLNKAYSLLEAEANDSFASKIKNKSNIVAKNDK